MAVSLWLELGNPAHDPASGESALIRNATSVSPVIAAIDCEEQAAAELAEILRQLGPIADRLGTRAVIAQYEADIGDPEQTRRGTAIAGTHGPLPRFLPVRDILRINFNMHALVPAEAVPARLARSARIPLDDNLASALPYAPSLRAALELVARYGDAVVPWYWRRLTPLGDVLRIRYGPKVPLGRIEPLATEVALATVHRIVETFVGDHVTTARVQFAAPTASGVVTLTERFSCQIGHGGTESFMAIPAGWGDLPSPYHEPALWLEGLARCEADIRLLQDPPLVGRVRAHVAASLDAGRLTTIAETARALGLSSRSLVRGLAEAGTTHHGLLDSDRKGRAHQLLAQPGLPLADVVERLGFSDQSSLGRKCQLWFGDSPARLRRQLTSGSQT